MAMNFKELRAGMSAASTAVSTAEHRRLVDEMSLRKARELGQVKIAWKCTWAGAMYPGWNAVRPQAVELAFGRLAALSLQKMGTSMSTVQRPANDGNSAK